MPYYRHLKDTEVSEDTDLIPYPTMLEARKNINVKTEMVTFIASRYERDNWHQREDDRFDGPYIRVPWRVPSYEANRPENVRFHYAHLSIKSPGLVAYTKNDEHGVNDRQTAVKPAKYLAEFYPGEFLDDAIRDYVAQCSVTAQELKIATSEADITSIFGRTTSGFSSCMQSKTHPEYDWDKAFQAGNRLHPCAVYGDSDLAVAYLGDLEGKVTARCVVWPEKKIINLRRDGTVYGDQTLKHILIASGYKVDSIIGAKVRLLRGPNGGIIMPYVDNLDRANVSPCGNWVILDNEYTRKALSCSNHETGYGDSSYDEVDRDDRDDDRDTDDDYDNGAYYTCEHCDTRYDYGRMNSGELNYHWCDDCVGASVVCHSCSHRTWNETTEVGLNTWCEACVDRHTVECVHPVATHGTGMQPCGETWIEVGEFSEQERNNRAVLHTAHLCRKHADGMQACADCARIFDASDMQCDCGLTVRCASTADMLTLCQDSIWWRARGTPGFWVWTNDAPHYIPRADAPLVPHSSTFTVAGMDGMRSFERVSDPRILESSF